MTQHAARSLSILAASREQPQRAAIVLPGQRISYRELARRVGARIEQLMGTRLEHGSRAAPVAVVARRDLTSIEWLLALAELGLPALLLHSRLSDAEHQRRVAALDAQAVLDGERVSAAADSHWVSIVPGASPASAEPALDATLAVVFSSGTSGSPRAIGLSRGAFLAAAEASAQNLGCRRDDRWLLCLPVGHVGGYSILIRCLIARATVVLPSAEETSFDPGRIFEAMGTENVTLASLVPTQLQLMLAASASTPVPPPALRAVLLGGAGADPKLLAAAADHGWPILTTYGLTEACSQVTTQRPGTVNRGDLGAGWPLPGIDLAIREGVIHVKGPVLGRSLGEDQAPLPISEDGWLETGDLGSLDDQGCLHVSGRRDDRIISGGENVDPAEVERILERCPGVVRACVFGLTDATWGEVVGAALIGDGATLDRALVAEYAARQLSAFQRPRLWAWTDEFATTATGKFSRRLVREQVAAQLVPVDSGAPSL